MSELFQYNDKTMQDILIDGFFLNDRITGIERFAMEMTKRIDRLAAGGEIGLILPADTPETLVLKNISYIHLMKPKPGHRAWKRIRRELYIHKHHSLCLNYANACTLCGDSVVFLHDIYCRQYPQDFITKNDKKTMWKTRLMYWLIAHRAKIICTVSEYSKEQIVKYYHVNPEKIKVIYSGSDHMNTIESDSAIFEKYPQLKMHPFYFTLGSLSLRKNLKWIVDHAERYPDELFVVSGSTLLNVVPPELTKIKDLKNVILTGYLSDGEVKALMKKCRAFVFPSYFEGFGLPPLEALACGAQIIVSNAASLPEIYGKCAHYIDPFKPDVDLDKLLEESVESPEPLFRKYSLDNSAKQIFELIKVLQKQ